MYWRWNCWLSKMLEGNQICPFLKVHPLMGLAGFSASSPLSGEDLEEEEAEESDSTTNFTTVVPSAVVSLSESESSADH